MPCNTNISLLFPGPVGQYTFKYNLKDTQKDDVEKYNRVSKSTQKSLSAARSHESDRSESIRRLLSASHVHQQENVLHGTMGSYLVRRKKRYIFSHSTVWCPLRDLDKILNEGEVFTTIAYNGSQPYYQNSALHYLCRPAELEELSAYDFYSKYEVVRATARN